MHKALKYSLIGVAGLVTVSVAGVAIVVTTVNPNRFKPAIISAVYQATGRKITLDGDISWKIYPNLGVTVRDVTLSNPDGFESNNFMSLHSADVSVGLIPLLSHKVVVKTLIIDGLNVALVEKNGLNNWTFTPPTESTPATTGEGGKPQPLQLEMSKFSFTNSTITYDNYDKKQHYGVKNTNLAVDTGFGGSIKLDQDKQLLDLSKVSFQYNDSASGELNFKVNDFSNPNYSGTVKLDKLRLNAIMDQFEIAKAQRNGMKLLDDITLNGSISGDMNNLTIKDFNFNFSDKFKGNTSLTVKDLKNPAYNGSLNLEPFNLNQVLDYLNIAVKERKDKPLLNDFAISSSGFSGDTNNITLNGLKISCSKLINANFGKLVVKNFSNPHISGSMNIAPFNVNNALSGLGMSVKEIKNSTVLNEFTISADSFNADTNNLSVSGLKAASGKSFNTSFSSVTINNIKNPQFNFTGINIAPMNLNQVLDSLGIAVNERKGKAILDSFALTSSNFSGNVNSFNATNLKVDLGSIKPTFSRLSVNNPKNPQFNGVVSVPAFSLNTVMKQAGMEAPKIANKSILDNIAVTTNFAGSSNSMNLNNMKAVVGKSNISGNLDVSSFKPLAVKNNITIDQIDVSDFSNINGYKVPIRQLHLAGNAKMASDMNLATLTASQSVQAGNITLQGISLDKLVLELNDIVNKAGKGHNDVVAAVIDASQVTNSLNQMKAKVNAAIDPKGKRDYNQTTNLGSFNANATVNNGNVNPSNFKLAGPSVNLSGNGAVNLAGNRAINYKANSQLLTKGINPIFQKLTFASSVTGTIDNPSASLDWNSLQQQILRYVVEQNKGQIQNAVKQQVNQAVGNQVRQAIGQQNGNQAVDAVSQGVTNAIGKLFGN